MRISINPGHCPDVVNGQMLDSGAVGINNTEAEVVRDIARFVCDDLEDVGIETLFIQENELRDITNASNEWGADYFVSIHCNAFDKHAQGTETYYYYGSDEGYALAKCVQHQLLSTMNSVNRGLKVKGYFVLEYTNCPAILTEIDFIDNDEREEYIVTHIEEIGHAIARGITDFLRDGENE